VRAVEERLRLPQREIERAQRRAAVAGDVAGGVEPGKGVALPLQDQQADEGLRTGEEYTTGLERVLVVETDVAQGRGGRGHGGRLHKILRIERHTAKHHGVLVGARKQADLETGARAFAAAPARRDVAMHYRDGVHATERKRTLDTVHAIPA
jgi:hypothetical protein